MSYILEALKRANAERERGAAPGLQAQAVTVGLPGLEAPTALRHWIAVGTVTLMLSGLVWWWRGTPTKPERPTAVTQAVPVVATVAATAPVPTATASPPPVAIPPQKPATVVPRPSAVAPSPSSAPNRVLALSELPEALRAGLPALQVNGSVYSSQASERLLILNGQALREGDEAVPGLVLERIQAKSAVLRWREARFTVSF